MIANDGYELVEQHGDWLKNPSVEHFHKNGVEVLELLLGYDHKFSKRVFFVQGDNGDSFGQFPNLKDALDHAGAMANLSEEQRHKYDE